MKAFWQPLGKLLAALACSVTLCTPLASASDHGGGGGAAPMSFVINLGNASANGRYLAIDLLLEGANPGVDAAVAAIKPRVQHEIILMLSGENEDKLRTTDGKKDLAKRIRSAINEILNEKPQTGVVDVLFTNFIIQ